MWQYQNTEELYHWAKGETSKNHKWIERIKTSKGYRYVYNPSKRELKKAIKSNFSNLKTITKTYKKSFDELNYRKKLKDEADSSKETKIRKTKTPTRGTKMIVGNPRLLTNSSGSTSFKKNANNAKNSTSRNYYDNLKSNIGVSAKTNAELARQKGISESVLKTAVSRLDQKKKNKGQKILNRLIKKYKRKGR